MLAYGCATLKISERMADSRSQTLPEKSLP